MASPSFVVLPASSGLFYIFAVDFCLFMLTFLDKCLKMNHDARDGRAAGNKPHGAEYRKPPVVSTSRVPGAG